MTAKSSGSRAAANIADRKTRTHAAAAGKTTKKRVTPVQESPLAQAALPELERARGWRQAGRNTEAIR